MKKHQSVLCTLGMRNKVHTRTENLPTATSTPAWSGLLICIAFVNKSKEGLLFLKGLGRQAWLAALWKPVKSRQADRHL